MIRVADHFDASEPPDSEPDFEPGSLVAHRRYGYRGVVVHVDRYCKADPVWYMSNKTQPDREQPWYHVLVDGSTATTYAAQTSLQPDTAREPVTHPLVPLFFSGFSHGRHVRNAEPWPA